MPGIPDSDYAVEVYRINGTTLDVRVSNESAHPDIATKKPKALPHQS